MGIGTITCELRHYRQANGIAQPPVGVAAALPGAPAPLFTMTPFNQPFYIAPIQIPIPAAPVQAPIATASVQAPVAAAAAAPAGPAPMSVSEMQRHYRLYRSLISSEEDQHRHRRRCTNGIRRSVEVAERKAKYQIKRAKQLRERDGEILETLHWKVAREAARIATFKLALARGDIDAEGDNFDLEEWAESTLIEQRQEHKFERKCRERYRREDNEAADELDYIEGYNSY